MLGIQSLPNMPGWTSSTSTLHGAKQPLFPLYMYHETCDERPHHGTIESGLITQVQMYRNVAGFTVVLFQTSNGKLQKNKQINI